jgi:hypothetical protein
MIDAIDDIGRVGRHVHAALRARASGAPAAWPARARRADPRAHARARRRRRPGDVCRRNGPRRDGGPRDGVLHGAPARPAARVPADVQPHARHRAAAGRGVGADRLFRLRAGRRPAPPVRLRAAHAGRPDRDGRPRRAVPRRKRHPRGRRAPPGDPRPDRAHAAGVVPRRGRRGDHAPLGRPAGDPARLVDGHRLRSRRRAGVGRRLERARGGGVPSVRADARAPDPRRAKRTHGAAVGRPHERPMGAGAGPGRGDAGNRGDAGERRPPGGCHRAHARRTALVARWTPGR